MDMAIPHSAAQSKAPRSRLFRKYALLIGSIVCSAPLVSGLVEMYFSYQEIKTGILSIQTERAQGAVETIESFLEGIESQIGWTMHADLLPLGDAAMAQRRLDFSRLLKQVPAITEVSFIDASGKERLLISRLALDQFDRKVDLSNDSIFLGSSVQGRYFGDVNFRRGSEPYIRLGVASGSPRGGVTITEINLKLIWEVVKQIEVGQSGYAFIVDSSGLLIAHPDMSRVLQRVDLSGLPQVSRALLSQQEAAGGVAQNRGGEAVLSSHASVTAPGWTVFVESPLSQAFAPLYGSIVRTALLLLGGIAISILASLFLARRIVEPIRSLQLGAAEIGAGNLDHAIQVSSGDELEDLADDFNRMTLKLRHSYDQVERLGALKRYFSPHLAELIVSSTEQSFTGSHRRNITVVFCDLRNFTRFSSSADPDVVMNVLREYFAVLDHKLLDFEATIDHFAGDGLMAFFNDPIECEDPSARAVHMSIEMQRDIGQLVGDWGKRGCPLGFGIGISAGVATIGNIGTEGQFHYTAIGSVANLASRLCDEADNGQILVSEPVLADIRGHASAESLGNRVLKGFPDPIPVFNITGFKNRTGPQQATWPRE